MTTAAVNTQIDTTIVPGAQALAFRNVLHAVVTEIDTAIAAINAERSRAQAVEGGLQGQINVLPLVPGGAPWISPSQGPQGSQVPGNWLDPYFRDPATQSELDAVIGDLTALRARISGQVAKTGDTMTGPLSISTAGAPFIAVSTTGSGHGVYAEVNGTGGGGGVVGVVNSTGNGGGVVGEVHGPGNGYGVAGNIVGNGTGNGVIGNILGAGVGYGVAGVGGSNPASGGGYFDNIGPGPGIISQKRIVNNAGGYVFPDGTTQLTAANSKVAKAGDTMTGPLLIAVSTTGSGHGAYAEVNGTGTGGGVVGVVNSSGNGAGVVGEVRGAGNGNGVAGNIVGNGTGHAVIGAIVGTGSGHAVAGIGGSNPASAGGYFDTTGAGPGILSQKRIVNNAGGYVFPDSTTQLTAGVAKSGGAMTGPLLIAVSTTGSGHGAYAEVNGTGTGGGVVGVVNSSGNGGGVAGEVRGTGNGYGVAGNIVGNGNGNGVIGTILGTGIGHGVAGIITGNGSGHGVYGQVTGSGGGYAVYANGKLFYASTLTGSDRNLKRDILPVNTVDAMARLSKLQIKTFEKKFIVKDDDGVPHDHWIEERQSGAIAQEAMLIYPEHVHEGSDGFLRLNEQAIMWDAIAGMQQMAKDLAALQIEFSSYKAAHP